MDLKSIVFIFMPFWFLKQNLFNWILHGIMVFSFLTYIWFKWRLHKIPKLVYWYVNNWIINYIAKLESNDTFVNTPYLNPHSCWLSISWKCHRAHYWTDQSNEGLRDFDLIWFWVKANKSLSQIIQVILNKMMHTFSFQTFIF